MASKSSTGKKPKSAPTAGTSSKSAVSGSGAGKSSQVSSAYSGSVLSVSSASKTVGGSTSTAGAASTAPPPSVVVIKSRGGGQTASNAPSVAVTGSKLSKAIMEGSSAKSTVLFSKPFTTTGHSKPKSASTKSPNTVSKSKPGSSVAGASGTVSASLIGGTVTNSVSKSNSRSGKSPKSAKNSKTSSASNCSSGGGGGGGSSMSSKTSSTNMPKSSSTIKSSKSSSRVKKTSLLAKRSATSVTGGGGGGGTGKKISSKSRLSSAISGSSVAKTKSRTTTATSTGTSAAMPTTTAASSTMSRVASSRFSHEPSSIPARPKLVERMKEIQQAKPFVEVNSVKEMEAQGFTVGDLIVADDIYSFHNGRKGGKEKILCKIINLDRCSPRYRLNMMEYSLRISRFLGGNGGKEAPQSKYFIRVFEQFKLKNEIYMFLEECINKSLYLILLDRDPFTPDDERRCATQICKGLGKLQELGIAHRFLKLQHILFDSHHNVRIVGWSKAVHFWDPDRHEPLFQNPERRSRKNSHLPPECFRGIYDPSKVDMWSLGVIMVCMQTRAYPFNVKSRSKFSAQWRQFAVKHEMNRYARAAINQAFFIDPKRRARPHEFLEHPYFKVPVAVITPKQLKTTIDPKYDPNMPAEKTIAVSQAFSTADLDNNKSKEGGGPTTTVECDDDPLDQGDDNASGLEGGEVGGEIPQSERQYESLAQESAAAEEQSSQAAPVSASSTAASSHHHSSGR